MLDFNDVVIFTSIIALTSSYIYFSKNTKSATTISSRKVDNFHSSSSISKSSNSRSLISKLKSLNHEKIVIIFFASQTGTAEDLAIRIQNEIKQSLNIPSIVLDFDDYDMEELALWKDSYHNWIFGFFMATYGEGEPTDNAADFYNWIMDGHGTIADKGDQEDQMVFDQDCKNVKYFIFGLGNKTYEYYNAISRRLDSRLTKLGAKRIGDAGEGNDDESMEEDYLHWAPGIIANLGDYFGVTVDSASKKSAHVELFLTEEIQPGEPGIKLLQGEITQTLPRKWVEDASCAHGFKEESPPKLFDVKKPFYSKVLKSKPLFTADAKDTFDFSGSHIDIKSKRVIAVGENVTIPRQCYHLEFDLKGSRLSYKTGDHIGIWASNHSGLVEKLANLLNVKNLNAVIKLVPNTENSLSATAKRPFAHPCSIRHILTYYLDILATLKQHHFLILAKYATDLQEKDILFEYSEDREKFVNLVDSAQKTLACVLSDFPSIKLPIGVAFVEILRPAAVRYYSISSSSLESPDVVSVTAVVVRYAISQTNLKTPATKKSRIVLKEGFATSCLERLYDINISGPQAAESLALKEGRFPPTCVPVYIRSSSFRLPRNHSKPVIMVGPGTGIAPFRAFVRERVLEAMKGTIVGPTWLFCGSRNERADNLYADEFSELLKSIHEKRIEIDLRIITAFSRDTGKKVYVQHRLAENGKLVWDLLQTGHFYICGDAKRMATDVNITLEKIAVSQGLLTENAAKAWIKKLRSENRFLEDVWS